MDRLQGLTASGAECAALKVPLDYARPQGRTLGLAISRIKATSPAKRRGILQTNPGGPGAGGLTMSSDLRQRMSPKVAAAYDVIGMDARGVGESSALNCGLTRAAVENPSAEPVLLDWRVLF